MKIPEIPKCPLLFWRSTLQKTRGLFESKKHSYLGSRCVYKSQTHTCIYIYSIYINIITQLTNYIILSIVYVYFSTILETIHWPQNSTSSSFSSHHLTTSSNTSWAAHHLVSSLVATGCRLAPKDLHPLMLGKKADSQILLKWSSKFQHEFT